ncbi:MAG: hypothetical protein ACRENP_16965 [Longimicrobiales bacterium]
MDAILTEANPYTGDARLRVDDPSGAASETHADGAQVTIHISGTGGVGQQGEIRVAERLRLSLANAGHHVTILDGLNDRGEDRLITVDGIRLVLQVTVTPNRSDFWREAHISSASTQVTRQHALQWLRDPIVYKAQRTPLEDRRQTLLAIAALHSGVIASPFFRDEYGQHFGCPSTEFGFASVWVVGPHDQFCGRLGNGRP